MKLVATSILTIAVLGASLMPAHAINRYNTNKMTCEQVQSALDQNRVAILRYPSSRNPSLTLYDRYVRSGYYCDGHTVPERTSVPTRNTQNCPVLHCIPRPDPCDRKAGMECDDPLRMRF